MPDQTTWRAAFRSRTSDHLKIPALLSWCANTVFFINSLNIYHMKLKIQSLLLIMVFAASVFSCKDDDDEVNKISNAIVYNGKSQEIKTAVFEDNTQDNGGGWSFWFAPHVYDENSNWKEFIWIDIPKERMGTKFQLTEENPYHWSWWVEYTNDEEELFYSGFGGENEMEDVKSGTISIKKTGADIFEMEADITFTDGKSLKIAYSGKMKVWAEGVEGSRKAAQVDKSKSPNY